MENIGEITAFVFRVSTPLLMLIIIVLCFRALRSGRREEHALIALDDEDKNIRYPVLFWENSLGRSRSSDIRVPDATVSRDHAVLLRREAGWFITDRNQAFLSTTEKLPADTLFLSETKSRWA